MLEKAGEAYRRQLRVSPKAVDYLKGRGLSGDIAKQFGLGYAPEGWRSLASVFANYDDPLLAESGLVIVNVDDDSGEEKRYDRFRDRVMFPIRNVKGECIGFGGRVLGEGTPKYLNSPETPVFSKGRELYGLFEARAALRERGYVLVTEGYMDVVALAQLGFANAVATLFLASETVREKLFRFTDKVVFSFDGDAAGRRAARKALDGALPYATDVRSVKFLFLPAEHDPDSFVREFGAEAFEGCITEAVPLSRFLIDAARDGCDLTTAEGRAHMASNARPMWSLLPDGAIKRQLLGELADLVQLGNHELADLWGLTKPSPAARRAPGSYEKNSNTDRFDTGSGPKTFKNKPQGGFQTVCLGATPRRHAPGPQRPAEPRRPCPVPAVHRPRRLGSPLQRRACCCCAAWPRPTGRCSSGSTARTTNMAPQTWGALQATLTGVPDADFLVRKVTETPSDIENDPVELKNVLHQIALETLRVESARPRGFGRFRTPKPSALPRSEGQARRAEGRQNGIIRFASARATATPPAPTAHLGSHHGNRSPPRKDCTPNVRPHILPIRPCLFSPRAPVLPWRFSAFGCSFVEVFFMPAQKSVPPAKPTPKTAAKTAVKAVAKPVPAVKKTTGTADKTSTKAKPVTEKIAANPAAKAAPTAAELKKPAPPWTTRPRKNQAARPRPLTLQAPSPPAPNGVPSRKTASVDVDDDLGDIEADLVG